MRWFIAIIISLSVSTQCRAADQEALEVMTRLQDLLRSDTNIARYKMQIITPDWQRTVRFDSWDDRSEQRSLIRILSPKKDLDTAYLKRDGSLWMYLPKLERKIRIPPSMMLSPWMGSSFTYDDLVKVASVIDDYTHRVIARNDQTITIESIPRPNAPVVWGRLVHVITRDGLPVSEEFYDEDGKKRRSLRFEDLREMDGRIIPTRWVMRLLDNLGKQTVLQIESVKFNTPIESALFTLANMQRSGQ